MRGVQVWQLGGDGVDVCFECRITEAAASVVIGWTFLDCLLESVEDAENGLDGGVGCFFG